MPAEPQTKALLDQFAALGGPPLDSLPVPQARAMMEGLRAFAAAGPEVAKVEDRQIPGPGGKIPLRIYTPAGSGPFPVLVWFHGGGWVLGDLAGADATCRELANDAGCVVVSVDYRLAPETKFPGAADDCYAATKWVGDNARAINAKADRIAVGGDSAGGNLSAVVSLMARDKGGPPLRFQLLVYPVTDANFDTASYRDNADGYLLTKSSMMWFWDHYLGSKADGELAYASPLRASDLSGLPPALCITAELDPLRDEGEAYAKRLEKAGVPTKLTRYDGTIHGFFSMTAMLDIAKKAVGEAAAALRAALV